MPELPEVERGRRVAEAVARGRRIVRARCPRDVIVYHGVSGAKMRAALIGARVDAVGRWGKHLWFELDRRPWPCFHFGMTGQFVTPERGPVPLASSGKTSSAVWPPRFTKIHLWFDDGGELVMTNARRLGRIRLRDDPRAEPPISELGFDPLLGLPRRQAFGDLLRRRRTPLKAVLLDQGFAAGVGNWIADEALYQAELDPRRRADGLSDDEVARLRNALGRVVRTAVRVDADKRRFPRTWLFHRRWGRVEGATSSRGQAIEHITIAGRTTAWVPAVQR